MRMILFCGGHQIPDFFFRVLRSGKFTVTFDKCFSDVISYCSKVPREGQESSWIISDIEEAYIRLHEEGFAHSVEVYFEGKLVGGLYGLAMGKAFFGESMFSLVSDASKVAFKALSDVLGMRGYDFIDCQMKTDHMIGLGAQVVKRDIYLNELQIALQKSSDLGDWQHFSLIEKGIINGATSNPSIFASAITTSPAYKEQLSQLEGKSPKEKYEALAIEDIKTAAQALRSSYDAGNDGYISIEVDPFLSNDTQGTIEEGKRLLQVSL